MPAHLQVRAGPAHVAQPLHIHLRLRHQQRAQQVQHHSRLRPGQRAVPLVPPRQPKRHRPLLHLLLVLLHHRRMLLVQPKVRGSGAEGGAHAHAGDVAVWVQRCRLLLLRLLLRRRRLRLRLRHLLLLLAPRLRCRQQPRSLPPAVAIRLPLLLAAGGNHSRQLRGGLLLQRQGRSAAAPASRTVRCCRCVQQRCQVAAAGPEQCQAVPSSRSEPARLCHSRQGRCAAGSFCFGGRRGCCRCCWQRRCQRQLKRAGVQQRPRVTGSDAQQHPIGVRLLAGTGRRQRDGAKGTAGDTALPCCG